jgi:hypothetical protein
MVKPKYIHFVKIDDKPKTSVWSVVNTSGGYSIGTIKWNPGWRQYCFFPEANMVISTGCMQDIIAFVESTNRTENRSYGRV